MGLSQGQPAWPELQPHCPAGSLSDAAPFASSKGLWLVKLAESLVRSHLK